VKFTAVFQKVPEGYIGFVEELPGANTQGATLDAGGMKRLDPVRYLQPHGCVLLREGGAYSVFVNRVTRKATSVPRHREINDFLARKICRDLQIPEP
jgi:mRNA interferase HicA